MAYRGPTFLPQQEYTQLEQNRFDQMTRDQPPPWEGLRVDNERARFEEMTRDTPPPSQVAVQGEQQRFLEMTADQPPPSASVASLLEPAPDQGAPPAPMESPSVGAPPAPREQGPTAPEQAPSDDPVSKTLAYLSKLQPTEPDAAKVGGAMPAVPEQAPGGTPIQSFPEPQENLSIDPITPDLPLPGQNVGLRTPFGPALGQVSLPINPAKPVRPTDETTQALAEGKFEAEDVVGGGAASLAKMASGEEPLDFSNPGSAVASIAKVVRALMDSGEAGRVIGKQGESLPGNVGGSFIDEGEAMARARLGEEIGGTGGGLGGGIRAAGEVGGGVSGAGLVKVGGESGPGVVYHDEIDLPKGPSDFKKYWDRSRNVLASMGEPGQEIARRVHAWRDGWKDTAGDWATRMPDVWKLSKNEFSNLVDVLEGAAKPVNERVATAQTQAKAVLDDVYALAQNAGVDVAPQIENYFPHRYATPIADQLKDARRRTEVANELLRTGQAASPEEARDTMVRFMQSSRSRRHGSLEMERLANLEGYEKTKEVLIDHLVGAAKRIHEVAQFGEGDAIVNRLFDGLKTAGYSDKDLSSARNLFQVIVGAKDYEGTPLPGVASGLRKYNALTRLGWAGIANATQGVNTATVTGVLRTLQSVPKAIWSAEDKEFALRAGLTLDNVLKEMRSSEGTIGQRLGRVAMPGFAEVEKFNRTLTAVAGRDFAVEQAAKAAKGDATARRALEAMGLDADAVVRRGGVLDPAEQRQAARSIDERTQFQVDPQDLPGWADSPWGKVVNQFGSFAYNQSAFVGREVLGKALEGDVRPLVRFLILAPLAQAASDETRNLVQGRESEQNPAKRVTQYVMGPLGKVGSIGRAVLPINSDRLPPERQAAMIAGAVLGPSLGTLTEGAGALINAERGNLVPAGRLAARQLPVVGTLAQNLILPYEKQGASRYVLPGRSSGRDGGRSSGRSSGR